MPKLTNIDLENHKLPTGNYTFSATKLNELGASEYTLVSIIVDKSGSVAGYRNEIVSCIKAIINSCKYSPRADNLMVRVVSFDQDLEEIHGFKLLSNINADDYDTFQVNGGMTALYDASENSVTATIQYGKTLTDNDFAVNGIVFVITDGMDNRSTFTPTAVKTALQSGVKSESLESLVSILIGIDISDPHLKSYLDTFSADAGFTQFIDAGRADAKTLAKLAEFVSKSISSQSQALGSGGPSRSISF